MPKLTLSLRTGFAAAAFSLLSTIPALAGDITVTESYARAAGASAMAIPSRCVTSRARSYMSSWWLARRIAAGPARVPGR